MPALPQPPAPPPELLPTTEAEAHAYVARLQEARRFQNAECFERIADVLGDRVDAHGNTAATFRRAARMLREEGRP
jgi:hypothetical protein